MRPPKPTPAAQSQLPVPVEMIERRIYLIRGKKVMLDRDLAELYQVETFNLNKAATRNLDRFPGDFMSGLNREEYQALRFQIGILKRGEHSNVPAPCLYQARRRHALQRFAKQARNSGQRRDHAGLRSAPPNAGSQVSAFLVSG